MSKYMARELVQALKEQVQKECILVRNNAIEYIVD